MRTVYIIIGIIVVGAFAFYLTSCNRKTASNENKVTTAEKTNKTNQTGDASLYVSTGGGVIGSGQHQNVNSASKQFVSLAQKFLDKATKTQVTSLPSTNEVKFYLLTNKGIFVGEEQVKNLDNNSSPWLKLFEEGNNVLTEIRKTSEK